MCRTGDHAIGKKLARLIGLHRGRGRNHTSSPAAASDRNGDATREEAPLDESDFSAVAAAERAAARRANLAALRARHNLAAPVPRPPAKIVPFVYSLSADDGSAWRRRLRASARRAGGAVRDLSAAADARGPADKLAALRELVRLAVGVDRLDVLVNVDGHSGTFAAANWVRDAALALPLAPVQLSTFGTHGTFGAPSHTGHVLGDAAASPPEDASAVYVCCCCNNGDTLPPDDDFSHDGTPLV